MNATWLAGGAASGVYGSDAVVYHLVEPRTNLALCGETITGSLDAPMFVPATRCKACVIKATDQDAPTQRVTA